jgi:sugar lactone lactonase YvrE
MAAANLALRRIAVGVRGPEGVAVDRDGAIYGGGSDGVVRRLSADGQLTPIAAVSDGQLGGLAFDRDDNLFVCDGFNGRVMRISRRGQVSVFAEWAGNARLFVPNFPAFDPDGDLWVSNSFDRPLSQLDLAAEQAVPRPLGSLVRVAPDGRGEVVISDMYMPNGLAIDPAREWLYVLQTTRQECVRLRLGGAAPTLEPYGGPLGGGPDGMAFARDGGLFITIPDARRVVVLEPDGTLETVAADPEGALMPFPTNCAFAGEDLDELVVATMNADHLLSGRAGRPGLALFNRRDG